MHLLGQLTENQNKFSPDIWFAYIITWIIFDGSLTS